MNRIEELIYVSPNEAEFLSLHLLLMHFDSHLQFETALSKIEYLHPEVLDSPHFAQSLAVVSMIRNRQFAGYFRTLTDCKDYYLSCVLAFPSFVDQIRFEYFRLLKHTWKDLQTVPYTDLKQRLAFNSDAEMESFLHFMLGRKKADEELYDIPKNLVYLAVYNPNFDALRPKLVKLKCHDSFKVLIPSRGGREQKIPLSTSKSSDYPYQVHINLISELQHCFDPDLLSHSRHDEPADPLEGLEETSSADLAANPRRDPQLSDASSTPKPKTGLFADPSPPVNKRDPALRQKAAEAALRFIKKKVKTLKKSALDVWSLVNVAKNKRQAQIIKDFLEEKNTRTLMSIVSDWRNLVDEKAHRMDFLLKLPPFEGGLADLDLADIRAAEFDPTYNFQQPFVKNIFGFLAKNWFGDLCHQQLFEQNFEQSTLFEQSLLFLYDSLEQVCGMFSFLLMFMLAEEDVEAMIDTGCVVLQDYVMDGWVNHDGEFEAKRLVLRLRFSVKESSEYDRDCFDQHHLVFHYATSSRSAKAVEDRHNRYSDSHESTASKLICGEGPFYYDSFASLMHDSSKFLLRISPTADQRVEFEVVGMTRVVCEFDPMQAVPTAIQLKELSKMIRSCLEFQLDKVMSRRAHMILISQQTHQQPLEDCLRSIKKRLELLQGPAASPDEDSCERDRYLQACLDRGYRGFLATKHLLLSMLSTVQHLTGLHSRDQQALRFIDELKKQLTARNIIDDVFEYSSINGIYDYIVSFVFGPFDLLLGNSGRIDADRKLLLQTQLKLMVWDEIETNLRFNGGDNFRTHWPAFFCRLLEYCLELIHHLGVKLPAVHVASLRQEDPLFVPFAMLLKTVDREYRSTTTATAVYSSREEFALAYASNPLPSPRPASPKAASQQPTRQATAADSEEASLGKRSLDSLFTQTMEWQQNLDLIISLL